ncbi:MAG: hypothetical protein CTY24_02825 [Methylobacter sp.]|nr:MAG: hypothetical protein CTY24_02825 [Methylobacter sp.]
MSMFNLQRTLTSCYTPACNPFPTIGIKPMNFRLSALIMAFVFSVSLAHAEPEEQPETPAQQEAKAAFEAAIQAVQNGPTRIPFGEQAALNLPDGYGFIPKTEGARFMKALGNNVDDRFLGLVIPTTEVAHWWLIDVAYNPEGYIQDDDAKDWKAEDLLNSLIEGTHAANEDRAARGIPEIEVVGWVEEPKYDEQAHRLVWSVAVKTKGQEAGAEESVNYNTLMLGREGYISMNLIASRNSIENLKPVAQTLLADLEFNSGKRYADFNADTDKVAEYGLAALVAGVAAKKLGLLAVVTAFVVKFAKVFIIAAAAGVAGLGKLFGKKKQV